jgi:hypothetical protein
VKEVDKLYLQLYVQLGICLDYFDDTNKFINLNDHHPLAFVLHECDRF